MALYQRLLLLLLVFSIRPVAASHIVGGEFEMIYIRPNTYRINMILYFDVLNGADGAKDENASVYIYRKRNNEFVQSFRLPLTSTEKVNYTQPACSKGEVVTNKLIYSGVITLASGTYIDSEGYYMVWQRCCRNYSISNIYSEAKTDKLGFVINPNARYAGQTFYLEFPAIVQNGKPFINSSPRLFPPLNDYACPGKPYYAVFSGTDDDGDSLAYTLVNPLNTTDGDAIPTPKAGPYPEVQWRPGYSLNRIMGGNPDLRISADGILRVTPGTQGLFAFAVRVNEYRNKVKIGEIRRDFQLYVVASCDNSVPPVIKGKKKSDAAYTGGALDVTFNSTTTDADRCIDIRVTDEDSKRPPDNSENITIEVKALNFPQSKLTSLPTYPKSKVLYNGSSFDFSFCLPKCPFVKNGPARIAIVAKDDACAVPLTDTLIVNVTVPAPPNHLPKFTKPTTNNNTFVKNDIREGDTFTTTIEAVDDDLENITLTASPNGYLFSDYGMSFKIDAVGPGFTKGTFTLVVDCKNYNFANKNSFRVLLKAEDEDVCKIEDPAKANMDLKVLLNKRNLPVIDSDLDPGKHTIDVSRKIGEPLSFTVTGRDPDNTELLGLNGQGMGFDLSTYRMTFPSALAISPVSSKFNWTPGCDDLKAHSDYRLRFVVNDQTDKCSSKNGDTLFVNVKLISPENNSPEIHFDNTLQLPFKAGAYEVNYGTKVDFNIRGTDDGVSPQDKLKLVMTNALGDPVPKGYIFKSVTGQRAVASPFTWPTDCSVFKDNKTSNSFGFVFKASDADCMHPLATTDTLKLRVVDPTDTGAEFTPPNVITPDGDGCNDYFAVEDIPETGCGVRALKINFPKDNCIHTFEYIKIVNRYGKEVFTGRNRNFRWYANEAPAGVYYYYIKFSDEVVFKGAVSVIR